MWLALLLGLVIRLGLAPWTEQRFDMYVWRLTGAYIYVYHLNPFWPWTGAPSVYPAILKFSYPPFWLLVIATFYPIWLLNSGFAFPHSVNRLWQIGVQTGNVYESYRSFIPASLPLLDLTLKLPIIVCDIIIALALYRALDDHRNAQSAVTWLWLFNPYVILVSAVWGQFDSIPTMFALLSILSSIKGRPKLSGFLLALGGLAKVFPVVYLPLVALYHWRKARAEAGKLIVTFLATCASFLPVYFILGNGIPSIYLSLASWPSPDWFGRNALGGLTWLRLIDTSSWNGNFPIFLTLLAPLYIIILLGFHRMKFDAQGLLLSVLGVTFALYITYTIVNEEYVLWFLPFVIIALPRIRALRLGAITMSGVAFVYAFLHLGIFYFLSPSLVSILPALRNMWDSFGAVPLGSLLMAGLSLGFSLITLACLTLLLLRHAFAETKPGAPSTLES
jgi:Gpi18-like mannosyltransferase